MVDSLLHNKAESSHDIICTGLVTTLPYNKIALMAEGRMQFVVSIAIRLSLLGVFCLHRIITSDTITYSCSLQLKLQLRVDNLFHNKAVSTLVMILYVQN